MNMIVNLTHKDKDMEIVVMYFLIEIIFLILIIHNQHSNIKQIHI